MRREELIRRSPLRILDRSIHGGVGEGNIGVIVARHGLGKTAFLIDIAMDKLLRGQKVLHVSLGHTVGKVVSYYDEIFADLAHNADLSDVWAVRQAMERNRRIRGYSDGRLDADRLRGALSFQRNYTDFQADAVVVDHFDFRSARPDDIRSLRGVAKEEKIEIWMSATTHRHDKIDAHGFPEPVAHVVDALAVLLHMAHDGEKVNISLLKDHDNAGVSALRLALDPTTLLVIEE